MYSIIGKTHQKQKQLPGLNKGTSSNKNKKILAVVDRPSGHQIMRKMGLENEDSRDREWWWRAVGEVKYQLGHSHSSK